MSSLLYEAIQLAQAGQREKAHQILQEIVRQDPDNESAWYWLASVTDSRSEYQRALNEVLRINPNNQQAREELSRLQQQVMPLSPPQSGFRFDSIPKPVSVGQSGKSHIITYGVVGLVLIIFSFPIAAMAKSTSLFCLINIAIPLIVGFLGSRAGIGRNTVTSIGQGAVEGGCSSAVTAGLISALCGFAVMTVYSSVQETLGFVNSGILRFTDIGAGFLVFAIPLFVVYFMFGLVGGLLAAYGSGIG